MTFNPQIKLASEAELQKIEPLFKEMYAHFYRSNAVTFLAEGGFERWCKNYDRSKSVSRAIFIATKDNQPVGLIEAQIKLSAPTATPAKIGHTAHLFVLPEFRRLGLASRLFDTQMDWFAEKNIRSFSLEVVTSNQIADKFWLSKGFKPAFLSYVRNQTP